MNIAFAKIGKSIKFAGKGYTPTGGDNEPEGCLLALANRNPNITFYIVGRSNYKSLTQFEKTELFPYNNVIDIWDFYDSKNPIEDHVIEYLKKENIEIDFSVFMIGQIGQVSIPGKIHKLKDKTPGFASVIEMTLNYTSPIIKWINETEVPYLEIVNDPRYVCNQTRDMLRGPIYSLSQYDYRYSRKFIKSYEDQEQITEVVNSYYSGVETLFCVGREIPDTKLNEQKTGSFTIVLNEGKPSRYKMLSEWILQNIDNVSIYGAWDNENAKSDLRFEGSRQLEEIQKIMSNVKYTFIIPIKEGWVTSKYIEMIHAGVIPFLHPTYDMQNHLHLPRFLRPHDPEQLMEHIKYLEDNDDYRLKLINDLQKMFCKPEYYDGSFINNRIMESVFDYFGKDYKEPDLNEYQKNETNTLLNFFN